jgi:hypothetical protein
MGGKEDRSILSRSSEDAAMYIQGQGPRVAASSAKGARVREGNPLRQSGRTPVDWGKGGKFKVPYVNPPPPTHPRQPRAPTHERQPTPFASLACRWQTVK